jgi:hypothetical protein
MLFLEKPTDGLFCFALTVLHCRLFHLRDFLNGWMAAKTSHISWRGNLSQITCQSSKSNLDSERQLIPNLSIVHSHKRPMNPSQAYTVALYG